MLINNTFSYGYYYNQLSIQQKQEVNNISSSLGVSIEELEFYFSFISASIGNISFFAFVFLLKNKPHLINTFRAQYTSMMGNFSQGVVSFNPINSNSPSSSNSVSPKQIGDAFLTNFSQKDLQALKEGQSLDLKNGIINNINDLSKFDKNGDGKLTGDELNQLQISIDNNKDGKIENNELKSAQDFNVKEINLKDGKLITNDGKEFNLKGDNVKIGDENKNATIIDSNKDGKVTKDSSNRVEPGSFSQFGSKESSSSASSNGSSNSSSNSVSSSNASSSSASSSTSSSSSSSSGSTGGSSSGGSGGGGK